MDSQGSEIRVNRSSFEKYLKVNVTLLRIFGLLPLPPNATILDKVFDILSVLAIPAMINIVVIPNVLVLFHQDVNVDIIMESLSGCTESFGLQLKYVILVFRRDKLKQLIHSCQDLWETNHPRGYEILLRYVKRGYTVTVVFLCVLNVTATCFAILPFVLKSTSTEQALPVSPGFVINSTLMYEVASCAQCVVIFMCGFLIVAVDSLLPVLLIISCGQFELMRAVLNDIRDGNTGENFISLFKANTDECIARHQRLIAHYANIEDNFNLYCLVQMFIGLYTIALGLLNLSMGTADAPKYITILMTGVVQIFICNWLPERVLQESNDTNLVVYNLPWYERQDQSGSTVSLLLMMTQHPIRLSAGKFTTLSMQTFSSILTNAISFLTVLKTFT